MVQNSNAAAHDIRQQMIDKLRVCGFTDDTIVRNNA
jgi:hypothetical protein